LPGAACAAWANTPLHKWAKKAFGSFSTDYGYRRTYAFRNDI
jgi:hypothetical protein